MDNLMSLPALEGIFIEPMLNGKWLRNSFSLLVYNSLHSALSPQLGASHVLPSFLQLCSLLYCNGRLVLKLKIFLERGGLQMVTANG